MVAMNLGTVVKEKGDFARAEAIFAENYQV